MKYFNLFSKLILERGYDYYIAGHVKELIKTDDGWTAVVRGSEDYDVSITLKYGEATDMECSCPYAADDRNCKHMAAVLYAIDDTPRPPNKNDIRDFINSVDENKRLLYLTDLLVGSEKLFTRFKSQYEEISDFNADEYIYQLDKAIVTYSGRSGFIHYRQITDFEEDIAVVLGSFERICETDDHEKVLRMALMISDRVENLSIDDSNGTVTWIMSHVLDAIPLLADSPDKKIRVATFKWICDMAFIKDSNYLKDFFFEPFTVYYNDPQHLTEKINLIDTRIKEIYDTGDSTYLVWPWLKTKISFMEILGVDTTEIEKCLIEHVGIPEARNELASRYEALGNLNKAIRILKNGIRDTEGSWEKSRFSERLINIYSRHDMKADEINECRDMLLLYGPDNIKSYKNYKSLFKKIEWEQERDRILPLLKNTLYIWREIYEEEEMYDSLIKSLQKNYNINSLNRYATLLQKDYTLELLEMYREEVVLMAEGTASRKAYRALVEILRHMQTFEGGPNVVSEIVSDWQTKYRRRKAMMEELKRL